MIASLRRSRLIDFAFPIVLVLLFVGFGLAAPGFIGLANINGILHSIAPITLISAGMALVVMMGKLDISLGSIALVAMGVSATAMQADVSPWLAASFVIVIGAALGALNGVIITFLGVNPLIATLGTMIAYRGLGNQITNAQVIELPTTIRAFGNFSVGGVFVDIGVALGLLIVIDIVHRRTQFGATVTAIGNDEPAAVKLGLKVRRTIFLSYVIAGVLAGIGGLISSAQVGAVTSFLGRGVEFTAVAVVVVGGISLFGGRGSILWGVLLGALTFEVTRTGLNYVGSDPYFYELVGGVIIFVAMFAAALKTRGLA
jgi:ribose/xylose/arabinose/galactoside ABC-type transport system permease subunit